MCTVKHTSFTTLQRNLGTWAWPPIPNQSQSSICPIWHRT